MNSIEFNNILQNPDSIESSQIQQLDSIVQEYPYFQAAKAIHLKNLKLSSSLKYNEFLKKTAAYTIDRRVLFDYITTLNFTKKTIKEFEILEEIEVIDPIVVDSLYSKINESHSTQKAIVETPIFSQIEESNSNQTEIKEVEKLISEKNDVEENPTDILELGKPLQFSKVEPHSFNEWMQLISQKPISRDDIPDISTKKDPIKEEKFSLIDKFIESNPKIKPVDKNTANIEITADKDFQVEDLMTETLAKVYLEQKKYDSAIKAYRILSLKYPEKSSFFANRIKAIKILQKNKS